MKATRKLASLLLALAVLVCMTIPAFAGTITVENADPAATYTAYKIFDVVYDTPDGNYSYTITKASEWYDVVKTYANEADGTDADGLTLTKAVDADSAEYYVVTTTNAFSPAKFAAALDAEKAGKTGTTLTDGTATVADLGYYFVTTTTGALCNLTTTDDTATIRDKNDIEFEKTANDESVELGQTVTYTITGEVPSTTGFDAAYKYIVTDTMDAGVTFNKDVTITVGGANIATDLVNDYAIDYTTENKFTVRIPVEKYDAGDVIEITYSARVDEDAYAVITNNSAVLEYTNGVDSTTKTEAEVVPVYTSKIVIDKFDSKSNAKLAGAKFVLQHQTKGYLTYADRTGDGYDDITWVANVEDADVFETDSNGAVVIPGLENDTYILIETEAPAGYNALTENKEIVIAGNATDATTLTYEVDVPNSTGVELPETGGIGTTIFYIVGATLALGAVVLLITKRRMSVQ